MGTFFYFILRIMLACCFGREHGDAKTVSCPFLANQDERKKFEKRCRNVCIEGHPDQEDMKKKLTSYFKEADIDNSGTIEDNEFDTLIEYTAEDARRLGFVPSLETLFNGDIDKIMKYRQQTKEAMQDKKGVITLDSYTKWTLSHIKDKVINSLDKNKKLSENEARQEAADFVKKFKDTLDKKSSWDNALRTYKDMFRNAAEPFTDKYKKTQRGLSRAKFNVMIEIFAEKPRVLGLVPKMTDLYSSSKQLHDERNKLFDTISGNEEFMTYEQFNHWLKDHLTEKVNGTKTEKKVEKKEATKKEDEKKTE